MKRILKKNQLIIAALAVMIAAAGYLNYSGRLLPGSQNTKEAGSDLANKELLDISDEDVASASGDIKSQDGDEGEVDGNPGEAVLTSGDAQAVAAQAKVTREQVRAKNKETLQSIIDSDSLSDAQKQDAVAQMVAMTEIAEKETAAETMLASKGFLDSVVSISEDSADVVVNASELTEANRAQIEDIVTRKTGVAAQNEKVTAEPETPQKEEEQHSSICRREIIEFTQTCYFAIRRLSTAAKFSLRKMSPYAIMYVAD